MRTNYFSIWYLTSMRLVVRMYWKTKKNCNPFSPARLFALRRQYVCTGAVRRFCGIVCADGVLLSALCDCIFEKGLWRCFTISNKELLINEEIHDKELRIVGNDGSQLGIMSARDALRLASEQNLDLVKIAPQATPPVCRIMDYGKYRFEQAKREKDAKKNQKIVEIKEVRLSLNIDTHDFNTKVNHALRFLEDGDKVKASIRFRGREMAHPEMGNGIMKRFAEACSSVGNVEKQPKLEGRSMLMFIAPKPTK